MRICSRCEVGKQLTDYYPKRRKHAKDGYGNICKDCAKAVAKEWVSENTQRHSATTRLWYKANPQKHAQSVAKWSDANRAARVEYNRNWRKENGPLLAEKLARRRASQKNACPTWATPFFISEAYELAKMRTQTIGFPWHVDHIVPISSSIVCGLHVEHNLRVISGLENASKSNRFWPDMP